jgi:Fic family protein
MGKMANLSQRPSQKRGKMSQYQPPYTVSSKIVSLVAEICEVLGRMSALESPQELRLRRINRIKTVHGSLAIEGNTLTEDQISAIIDGKKVVAPLREIQEVRNAVKVYDQFTEWEATNDDELLKAHEILMSGLLDAPGQYRTKAVGIMGGKDIIHMAPPAGRVLQLMNDLFSWLRRTDAHPLIASSVFHYELEFIHPFEDGNGRMGRLWQTLILAQWNPLFADIPVESMIYTNQQEYYKALNQSTNKADCAPFIEFILENIISAIKTDQVSDQVSDQVKSLISAFKKAENKAQTALELMDRLKLSHRPTFRKNYLHPALEAGLIEMTVPDKPRAKNQKYRLTAKGRMMRDEL